jgi:hypothetical protein
VDNRARPSRFSTWSRQRDYRRVAGRTDERDFRSANMEGSPSRWGRPRGGSAGDAPHSQRGVSSSPGHPPGKGQSSITVGGRRSGFAAERRRAVGAWGLLPRSVLGQGRPRFARWTIGVRCPTLASPGRKPQEPTLRRSGPEDGSRGMRLSRRRDDRGEAVGPTDCLHTATRVVAIAVSEPPISTLFHGVGGRARDSWKPRSGEPEPWKEVRLPDPTMVSSKRPQGAAAPRHSDRERQVILHPRLGTIPRRNRPGSSRSRNLSRPPRRSHPALVEPS